jgi:hypothetical protein
MWLLLQCTVMIAVGWTAIAYHWTPGNNVARGILMQVVEH